MIETMMGSSSFVEWFYVEPEYCPEAVVHWFLDGLDKRKKKSVGDDDERQTRLKAKKHLAALKWVFWYGQKGDRKELRYTSPLGKVYYSLRMACKGCIDEGGVPQSMVNEHDHEKPKPKRTSEETPDGVVQSRKKRRVHNESNVALRTTPTTNGCSTGPAIAKPRVRKVLRTMMKLRDEQEGTSKEVSRCCKNNRVLSRLIQNKAVVEGTRVHYLGKNAQGWITSDGINCCCCNKVYTLSGFEFHAGSKNHRPAANIILEDGRSLFECDQRQKLCNKKMIRRTGRSGSVNQMKGNKRQVEVDFDVCRVCHYGGTLIICDLCGSTFHQQCLGLKDVPEGDWFCPSCSCGICAEASVDDDAVVRTCDQCERKFHVGCVRSKSAQKKWFCSVPCEHIFSCLRELVGRPISLDIDDDEELTWRLLKPVESESVALTERENKRKLNVALDVMKECFEPAKDPVTGRGLAEDVIFGRRSEVKYNNFQGFYTVVLERKGKVVSAATLRVHGEVAELPLVATRFKYRRHGMCRRLMNELQKQLIALGVVTLILPSAPSMLNTWLTKFGFSEMTASERLKYLSYTFLDFQDTIMCQKLLTTVPSATCSSPVSVLQGKQIEATE